MNFEPDGQPDPSEPNYEPWGPVPPQKLGSIWGSSLDLSLNPKLDPSSGHTNPIMDPKGQPQTRGTYGVHILTL